jgi:hypothetical protein
LIVQHPAVVPVKQVVETQEEKDQFLCLIWFAGESKARVKEEIARKDHVSIGRCWSERTSCDPGDRGFNEGIKKYLPWMIKTWKWGEAFE